MSHHAHAANGFADAEPAIETPASLVSLSQPSSPPGELSTPEAAQALQRSTAWVKRHAVELGGRLVEGAYRFPSVAIERRRTTVEKITFGGARLSPAAAEEREGERDARVFTALREGLTVAQVVEREKVPVPIALRLRDQWIEAHRADGRGLPLTCRACSRPSDPRFAFCSDHAAHVQVLTEEQRRVLAAQDIPTAIRCTACASVADAGVCSSCADAVTVAVEGGVIVVRMGARVLRELPLSLLAPTIAAPPAPAAAPTPETPPVSAGTKAMLDHVNEVLAAARTPLKLPETE